MVKGHKTNHTQQRTTTYQCIPPPTHSLSPPNDCIYPCYSTAWAGASCPLVLVLCYHYSCYFAEKCILKRRRGSVGEPEGRQRGGNLFVLRVDCCAFVVTILRKIMSQIPPQFFVFWKIKKFAVTCKVSGKHTFMLLSLLFHLIKQNSPSITRTLQHATQQYAMHAAATRKYAR